MDRNIKIRSKIILLIIVLISAITAQDVFTQTDKSNDLILSREYSIAEKALEKAVIAKDKTVLRLGLKSSFLPIKHLAVKAIIKLDDKRFIPDLIEALENNQGALSGNNETAVLQTELSEIIISAIERFIGLKFEFKLDPTKVSVMDEEDDVQRIIRQSELWWETNKDEFQGNAEQQNFILSKDYAVAESALKNAILEKDKETIRLGLKSPILLIRLKTVEAIEKLDDDSFIPHLIEALQDNQGVIGGGSEVQILQNNVNKAIISALGHLTKLEFEVSEPLNSENIQNIIKQSREWWEKHQDKNK